MKALLFTLPLALFACGSSNTAKPDAKPDAVVDHDAPPDVAIDAPPMATGTHNHYIIDHEITPTTNMQAMQYGLDLDGNGTVDNQLGMVLGVFASMGFAIQTDVSGSVDSGNTLLLADLQTTDFTTATGAGFNIYYGANPMPAPCSSPSDTTCRHHLTGTGTFDVAATTPSDPALVGNAASGTFTLGAGTLPIELALIPVGTPIQINLIGARVKLTGVSATGITSGVLAGGVSQAELTNKVYPGMVTAFTQVVYADCCGLATSPGGATCNPNGTPACGCTADSGGKTILSLFDTGTKDCKVSLAEITGNSIIQALFAPDVTLGGTQALSFGVGITAVGATFTAP